VIEAWTCRKPSTEKGVPGMSLWEGTPEAMAPSPSAGCQLRKRLCFHAAAGHPMAVRLSN